MKFAYIRVSSVDQNEERQILEMKNNEIDSRNIFIDKQTGKHFERDQYSKLKMILRQDDELYIHELDRLGRDKKMIKNELQDFLNKGVLVRILDIPTTLMDFSGFGELQKSIMEMVNTILIEVLSTQAETELKKIKKRQAEGIAAAKTAGKYNKCGRPKKELPKEFPALYEQWKAKKFSTTAFAKLMGYKNRQSIYILIKRYESQYYSHLS